jgi:hypothetical protein
VIFVVLFFSWMEEAEAGSSGVKKPPSEYIDVVLVGGGHANVQVHEESLNALIFLISAFINIINSINK